MNTQELVAAAIGLVAPILVGLITRASTSPGIKAMILAAIAAAVGIGTGFLNTPPETVWVWQSAAVGAVLAWVTAVATHYGFLKPTGVTATLQGTANADPAVVAP
jgi:hypothetical protein